MKAQTILVYTSPARGHLYPIVDTALALLRRGLTVTVRTLANDLRVVEAAGLRAGAIDVRIEALVMTDWRGSSPVDRVARALSVFAARAALEVDDLRLAIDQERPHGLLIDTNCWGAQAVAEKSGLPWATWHPYPWPAPSVDVPPFGLGLRPARGAIGRMRDRTLRPLMMRPFRDVLRSLNATRSAVGVPALSSIADVYSRPPLVLLQSAEPFEYPRRDWGAHVARVGPGLWSPPAEAPRWLESAKPIILVTCSTEFQDDGPIARAAIEAFTDDDRFQLVCTTAGVDPATIAAPSNVIVQRFLPHALLLPRTDVVVAHGGMGITQRAIASGAPLCLIPWGRDQLEVGRRLVQCGAGVVLPRAKISPKRLRRAVDEARACNPGVVRVQAAYQAAGGAERSAQLVTRRFAIDSAVELPGGTIGN
jgi:MGT family glycosyltransferase